LKDLLETADTLVKDVECSNISRLGSFERSRLVSRVSGLIRNKQAIRKDINTHNLSNLNINLEELESKVQSILNNMNKTTKEMQELRKIAQFSLKDRNLIETELENSKFGSN